MYEYDMGNLLDHAADGRVYEDELFLMYSMMTDYAGAKRGLTLAMNDAGIQKIPTTRAGTKSHYFRIPSLKYYTPANNGFDEIEVEI